MACIIAMESLLQLRVTAWGIQVIIPNLVQTFTHISETKKDPAMNGAAFAVGVIVIISLVECKEYVSIAALENLTNVISLTENNFDQKIAQKHQFVLFYAEECAKCNALSSVWQELAESFNNDESPDIAIAKADCSIETRLCTAPTGECPSGYAKRKGDLPGWGNGIGGSYDLTRRECAQKCNGDDRCMSFEHSDTQMKCNLNKIAEPSQGQYLDFVFCTKTALVL